LGKQIKKNNEYNKNADDKNVPAGPGTKERDFIVIFFSHVFGPAFVLNPTSLRDILQRQRLSLVMLYMFANIFQIRQ